MNNIEIFRKYTDTDTFNKLIPLNNINDLIVRFNNEYSSYCFYRNISGDVNITYKDFYCDILKMKSYIETLNIDKGCNVGVLYNNSYFEIVLILALLASSIIPVMIDPNIDINLLDNYKSQFDLVYLFNQEINFNIYPLSKLDNDINGNDVAIIFLTIGRDGITKGAMLSHEGILQGACNGCYGIKDVFYQTYYDIIPFYHVYGFIRSVLTPLFTASTITICTSLLKAIKEMPVVEPTILVLVPELAETFYNFYHNFNRNIFGNKLKVIVCGGAFVKEELVRNFYELGISLYPGYGLTEMSNMVTGNPESLLHPNSIGLLFPNQEYKIVNGELLLKGRNLMIGYYHNELANNEAFIDGYFKTGDLISIDNEGFLYFDGINKNILVLPNGENVSIEDFKNVLNKFDFIEDFKLELINKDLVLNIKINNNKNTNIELLKNKVLNDCKRIKNVSSLKVKVDV